MRFIFFALATSLLIQAQAPPLVGLRSKAETRLTLIAKQLQSVDSISAQGLRFKRLDEVISSLENEVNRLNLELETNICPEQKQTLTISIKMWSKYYLTERKHFDTLNSCLGTNHLEASHYALAQMLSFRCGYLASQLIDFERR